MAYTEPTSEDIKKAIAEFLKNGGLIRKLPDQMAIRPISVRLKNHPNMGLYESLSPRDIDIFKYDAWV